MAKRRPPRAKKPVSKGAAPAVFHSLAGSEVVPAMAEIDLADDDTAARMKIPPMDNTEESVPALAYVTLLLNPTQAGFGSFSWSDNGTDAAAVFTNDGSIHYRRLTYRRKVPSDIASKGQPVDYYLFWDAGKDTPSTLAWAFQVDPSPDGSYTVYCGTVSSGKFTHSQRAFRVALDSLT